VPNTSSPWCTAAEPQLSQPAEAPGQSGTPPDLPEFYAPDPALAGYIRTALETNPAVQESLASYRASLARVHLATALPGPPELLAGLNRRQAAPCT
jgi:outer membrane protein TolC